MFYLWECNKSDDRIVSEEIVCLQEYIEEHYTITPDIEISYEGKLPISVLRNGEEIGTIKEVSKI